jgi:alkanesulfonate monooxygenase SsuD/methylene tetrahydromethanopterin reductase-like flavin-dependent oxidoreductase (luciferase family)
MEFVEVTRRLLDGEVVDWAGEHFTISGAHVGRPAQNRIPIVVGGNVTACSATLVATPTSSASRVSGGRSMTGTVPRTLP